MKRSLMLVVALTSGVMLVGGVTSAVASSPRVPEPGERASRAAPPPERTPKLESVYVPIRPCRIVDTRSAAAGKFAPNTTRTFRVRGTSGFPTQGGTADGCGVPGAATGVTVNTTMTSITGNGYLSNYPVGGAASTTNFTIFAAGNQVTANPTFALATAGTEPSLAIKSSSGANTHLIIDVTGYYAPQIEGMIASGGGMYAGSPRMLEATRISVGRYVVTIDSDVRYCSAVATSWSGGVEVFSTDTYVGSNAVEVHTVNSSTAVAEDAYVYLQVQC